MPNEPGGPKDLPQDPVRRNVVRGLAAAAGGLIVLGAGGAAVAVGRSLGRIEPTPTPPAREIPPAIAEKLRPFQELFDKYGVLYKPALFFGEAAYDEKAFNDLDLLKYDHEFGTITYTSLDLSTNPPHWIDRGKGQTDVYLQTNVRDKYIKLDRIVQMDFYPDASGIPMHVSHKNEILTPGEYDVAVPQARALAAIVLKNFKFAPKAQDLREVNDPSVQGFNPNTSKSSAVLRGSYDSFPDVTLDYWFGGDLGFVFQVIPKE